MRNNEKGMGKKILIVDDDPRNIFALKASLKSRKHDCVSCNDALEAIKLLEGEEKIDVVLMDMMMPEMDGYEAIPIIKSLPNRQGTPVIAVTAQAMVGDREKCISAGADDYISKPVDLDKLLLILDRY
jgi:two-component system OmpR family response regulator